MIKKQMSNILIYIYSFTLIFFSFFTHNSLQAYNNSNISHKLSFLILAIFIVSNIILWVLYISNVNHQFTLLDWCTIIILMIFMIGIIFHKHIITTETLAVYLFIPNCRFVNFKKFIHYDFFSKLFLLVLILTFYFIGIFPNNSGMNSSVNVYESHRIGSITQRYSLGFVNPNILAGTLFTLLCSFLVIYFTSKHSCFNKMRNVYKFCTRSLLIIMLFMIFVLINGVANSQSIDISIILLIICFILYFFGLKKVIRLLVVPIFVAVILLSIIAPLKFDNYYLYNINSMLSGRLYLQHSIISFDPINYLGHSNVGSYGQMGLPIDNLPLSTILLSGIIGFILYYIILFILSIYSIKCNHIIFPIIFITLIVLSMVEKQPSDFDFMAFFVEPIMIKYQKISTEKKYFYFKG